MRCTTLQLHSADPVWVEAKECQRRNRAGHGPNTSSWNLEFTVRLPLSDEDDSVFAHKVKNRKDKKIIKRVLVSLTDGGKQLLRKWMFVLDCT